MSEFDVNNKELIRKTLEQIKQFNKLPREEQIKRLGFDTNGNKKRDFVGTEYEWMNFLKQKEDDKKMTLLFGPICIAAFCVVVVMCCVYILGKL